MYALVLFEYHFGIPPNSAATPLDRVTYRQDTLKSFRRTLLRTVLHNLDAAAPVTHLDGITYRRNCLKSVSPLCAHSYGHPHPEKSQVIESITLSSARGTTRKSFRRILLRRFGSLTPLESHSYRNMGGAPSPVPRVPCLPTGTAPNPGIGAKYLCSLSLTGFLQNASKIALCFLSLTDTQTRKYLCSLSLTKKPGGRVARFLRPDGFNGGGACTPGSPEPGSWQRARNPAFGERGLHHGLPDRPAFSPFSPPASLRLPAQRQASAVVLLQNSAARHNPFRINGLQWNIS
jgi:hypothetical protein